MVRTMCTCAVVLAAITLGVALDWAPLMRFDDWASTHAFAATYGRAGRVAAWTAITDWAAPGPMRNALLLAGVAALAVRRIDLAVWLVALSLVEGVVAPASKHLLERPRPDWVDPITVLGSTSYPSGHATAAATTAVALALVVRHGAALAAAITLAVSVAASRVFLGAHYPSDVVAGLLLGALLAATTRALLQAVTPAPRRGVEEVGTTGTSAGT